MSPTSIGRVAAMLRILVAWVTCRYSQVGINKITHEKMVKVNGDKGRDMVWVLVGVRSCVAVEVGHSLVTPFFPCLVG